MDGVIKRIAVLGSTGSIGQQTLEVVRAHEDRFQVVGLGGGRNAELLARQVEEFQPKFVSFQGTGGEEQGKGFLSLVPNSSFLSLEEIACHPDVDLVVVATSGKAGLAPTLSAIRAGKQVALANKEVLVMAGGVVMAEAKRSGVEIAPVDSEHSAIWQCLQGEYREKVARLILTASGGPFRHYPLEKLDAITPEQALKHPTWQMGKKVTVDSATLMNKGMEVIEAHWLFHMPIEHIGILIHPESMVHSLVEFGDGSVKAQLSLPDMRLPIQYALSYPERLPNPKLPRIDWSKLSALNFEPPDMVRFPCLKLAIEAGGKGGTYPGVLCAADEVAVGLFLSHRIGFLDIAKIVEEALAHHQSINHPSLEEILAADAWAREYAENWRVK
ncbi:MAG TPA: 1-deoxy-D-xylulose-5-phosphate reductoisomerase [Dehalococcoidia bacterium]|nr:1-deoxy-D-xylulose-5-phosphate reductoisomerase [Dehalococcoidia bacterium]